MTQAKLSGDGPRGNFSAYVEWVLVSCNSAFTISLADKDFTSPTPDPEPSQASPHCVAHQLEATADRVPELNVTDEPSPIGVTQLRVAPEPEPHTMSDQVRDPASMHTTVDETVEHMRVEVSPAHCTTVEGELNQDSEDLIDVYSEIRRLPSSESSSCPDMATEAIYELSVCLELFVPS